MRPALLALSFLTVIRIPSVTFQERDFARSLFWFPLAGLVVGSIQWSTARICSVLHLYPELSALLIVSAGVLITGGLHLDGVADTADGFGAGNDAESVLRIMKDERIGVFAIAAIVFCLLARYLVYSKVLLLNMDQVIWLAPVISRALLPLTMTTLRYARTSGTAAPFAGANFFYHALPAALLVAAAIMIVLPDCSAPILIAALSSSAVFCLYSFYRIRGYTGDTLGAQVEFCELAILWSAAEVNR